MLEIIVLMFTKLKKLDKMTFNATVSLKEICVFIYIPTVFPPKKDLARQSALLCLLE